MNAAQLDAFGRLAQALGILDASGNANGAWFNDPVGGPSNPNGLRSILGDDGQREALLEFVDEVLGPPERAQRDDAVWVPLFQERDPAITIFAVVEPAGSTVRLGIGVQYATGAAVPTVGVRLHVPLFQLARGSAAAPADSGGLPGWLLLGRAGGRIDVAVDVALSDSPPPAREPSLGGVSATLGIPTAPGDTLALRLELRDLQLPGATAPRTFTLDAASVEELGPDVFELITGLLRAQADALDPADPALRPFAALTGMLGLRSVSEHLPPLPLAELPTRGVAAVVGWLEQVLGDDDARDAWLGELAALLDGDVDAARDAVSFDLGAATVTVGLRVGSGAGSQPVLTPWVELALDGQAGARLRLAADLFRADVGTGAVLAVPDLRAEAVFGAAAGGAPLLAGDPGAASLRVGFALTADRRPTFVLTLHDATIAGRPHPLLDLSSPEAALDAAGDVLTGALDAALAALGEAGSLAAAVLGLSPPAGVSAVDAAALLRDPVAEVRRYWLDLTANAAAAGQVLGQLRRLLTGAAAGAVPGSGTEADPWRLAFAPSLALVAWRQGPALLAAFRVAHETPVLDDLEARVALELGLLRAELAAGTVQFGTGASAVLALRQLGGTPLHLPLGEGSLEATSLGVRAGWTPGAGLGVALEAPGLALTLPGDMGALLEVGLPLPRLDNGRLVLDPPDWDEVQDALAGLLRSLGSPVIEVVLRLAGWSGTGPQLRLSGLLGTDPAAALQAWLADVVLDCQSVRAALSPVAALLSGFTVSRPLGVGSARRPFRCPVAGEPRAPGLAAWLVPDCRPLGDAFTPLGRELSLEVPPEPEALVDALALAARSLEDVGDLLVGRDSLAEGLRLLAERFTGTDGLVGPAASLPDGVEPFPFPGFSYAELVALGRTGALAPDVLGSAPAAVVHVGCEADWLGERPAGSTFDLSGDVGSATIPAAAGGEWFVRLPTPAAAAAARPDRGAVGEQAARLAAVLAARTDPIVVVAYGACGAAAIRAAADRSVVSDVVTVGTPWAGFAADALATGLSGDALRLLEALRRRDAGAWSDALLALEATPLQSLRGVVERAAALVAAGDTLPSAGGETRRAGLGVRAVFGELDADTVLSGLGALVQDGIMARGERAAEGPHPVHTGVHVGLDLPVFDLDLAGLLVGAGATLELCSLERDGAGLRVGTLAGLTLELHFGVRDGWLVGGPGALQRDLDVRWLSARIAVPFDGRDADTELVLHEARAFSAYRERWVVRADADGLAATLPLPEVRALVSAVLARLRTASAELAALLDVVGITRDGGLDPDLLDRLLFDPAAVVAEVRARAAAELAAALRALVPAALGTGSRLGWAVGPATVSVDLATRAVSATLLLDQPDFPPVAATVEMNGTGPSAELVLGALDPNAGGLRLVGRAGGPNELVVEWQGAGAAVRRMPLLPTADAAAFRELVTVVLPAALAQGLATFVRDRAGAAGAAAVDAALEALSLLEPPGALGLRRVRLPIGLVGDPAGWLRHAGETWRTAPAAAAVQLLDALRPLVTTTPPGAGWELAPGIELRYAAEANRVRLAFDVALSHPVDGLTVATRVSAGLLLGGPLPPSPVLSTAVAVDGRGLRLEVAPTLRLFLDRPAPATPLQLFPEGPGLGTALATAAESALPPLLNALAARRSDVAASLLKDVGAVVFDVTGALDLRDGTAVTAARLTAFAADPAGRLVARLPQLAATGLAALARAVDPAGAVVQATGPVAGATTLRFGAAAGLTLTLDGGAPAPALVLGAGVDVPGFGRLELEALRLSAAGVQLAARIGPAELPIGGLVLRPLVVVRAGVADGSFTRLLGIGLAFDGLAASSVEFRWALDATPPSVAVVTRGVAGELLDSSPAAVATRLLALGVSLATGLLIDELGPVVSTRARQLLGGVLFLPGGSTDLDPVFFDDLLVPERLFTRLQRLLWNAATASSPLTLTIDGTVTIGLDAADAGSGRKRLGVRLSLAPGRRFAIATGDPQVELEVDASWIRGAPPGGLSIYVLESGDAGATFQLVPAVRVAGIGLRFAKAAGPLLDLGGVSLDAIGVHVYGEASPGGAGGGAQLELEGFAIAPTAGGGDNPVANSILNDAGAAGQANRPAFSPALAVQMHPGDSGPSVSLRAGEPPGPWWLRVQRQLGPLYLEQVGFDAREQDGRIVRIALLFDGSVSLFGLTAAVDQLSFTWLGGDVFDVNRWAVDLQGLAVSAEMAGVSIAGGLLKTTADGQVSYVGMLLGRFGIYGLSLFGGYTEQAGSPSFFVFGALNGPIGGPPAFFVTGIGGGLGINRALRVPEDMSRFNEYPFIRALDAAAPAPADPLAELRRLGDYFPPVRGNFWFAAGISFTCFSLVDGIAVVSVSFGEGLEVNLFGLARMALPRPQAALVSIELGLLARFSTREGLFSIRAQLTDNSWLLYPDVRLTGGFAFVIWWKGPNAGQFVLTLGGYHPSFQREGYPDVPRLGLVWQVTPQIVVKGGSYFALTSEALMAGVDVEVSADFGWAWARIGFGAHGIIYFDPFWFEVMAYARIAAGVKIKTFLGTVRFGISLSAEIRVWGPDFSGQATLEVGPASFSVSFGSRREIPARTLEWAEFTTKYLEDAGGAARALSSITGRGTLPAATGGATAAPSSDGTRERPFEVFAEFEVTVTSTIPVRQFELDGTGVQVPVPVLRSDGAPANLGLKPMKASGLSSTLVLELERWNGTRWVAENTGLAKLGANLAAAAPRPAGSSVAKEAFPIGAWGEPEADTAVKPLPKGDVLFAGNQVRLVAEAAAMDRGPELDYYRVEASRRPLPLQAGGAARSALLTRAAVVEAAIAAPTTTQAALTAARTELFAPRVAAPAEGLLARGRYSNLARAAFAGDRTAPPLFGSLADGLATTNAADPTADVQPPRETVRFEGLRPPVVSALLTGGAGVAARPDGTTFRNGRAARRPAPTLSSVQARLAMQLPIRMVVTPPPAATQGKTVVPSGVVPRTDAPGTARTYLAGVTGGVRGLDAMLGGSAALQPKSARAKAAAPRPLAAGDIIVLTLPDAALDVDAQPRPALGITGTARVAMLRGNGAVLFDDVVTGSTPVPAGTALIGVQAGGGEALTDGLAGWHASARVAVLSATAALAPGCVITTDAGTTGRAQGWSAAAELVAGAASVTTHFAAPARTVAVVLADADPERLGAPELELIGARRALLADGSERPPTVVLRGSEATLVYAIAPEGRGGVTVRMRAGGDWRLAGVLAGTAAPDAVARVLVERGPLGVIRRILAVPAENASVAWQPAAEPRTVRGRAKKTMTKTTKKTTQKAKKTAKKTAKKSARKRTTGRKGK